MPLPRHASTEADCILVSFLCVDLSAMAPWHDLIVQNADFDPELLGQRVSDVAVLVTPRRIQTRFGPDESSATAPFSLSG